MELVIKGGTIVAAAETYKAKWVPWPPPWVRSNRDLSSLSVVWVDSATKRGMGQALLKGARGPVGCRFRTK